MDSDAEFVARVWIEVRRKDFDQRVSVQLAGSAKNASPGYS